MKKLGIILLSLLIIVAGFFGLEISDQTSVISDQIIAENPALGWLEDQEVTQSKEFAERFRIVRDEAHGKYVHYGYFLDHCSESDRLVRQHERVQLCAEWLGLYESLIPTGSPRLINAYEAYMKSFRELVDRVEQTEDAREPALELLDQMDKSLNENWDLLMKNELEKEEYIATRDFIANEPDGYLCESRAYNRGFRSELFDTYKLSLKSDSTFSRPSTPYGRFAEACAKERAARNVVDNRLELLNTTISVILPNRDVSQTNTSKPQLPD